MDNQFAQYSLDRNMYRRSSTEDITTPFQGLQPTTVAGDTLPYYGANPFMTDAPVAQTISPGSIVTGITIQNFLQKNDATSESNGDKIKIGPSATIAAFRSVPFYNTSTGDFSTLVTLLSPRGLEFGNPNSPNVFNGSIVPVADVSYDGIPAYPGQSGIAFFGPTGDLVLRIGDISQSGTFDAFSLQNYPFIQVRGTPAQNYDQPVITGYGEVYADGTTNPALLSAHWTVTYIGVGTYQINFAVSPFPTSYGVLVTVNDAGPVFATVSGISGTDFTVNTWDITGAPVDAAFFFETFGPSDF